MNYRHAFHAGNFADVFKHVVLARLVTYLKRKDAAFRVVDTHAGAGLYDLAADAAQRTGEWRDGIGRLAAAQLSPEVAALLQPYLDAVGSEAASAIEAYPGSPLIVRRMLRRLDRLTAIELHPEDHASLSHLFAGDHQVKAIALDGWLALGAHLPPKEKRGLVLVDPPFEVEGEFERLVAGLRKAYGRWPGGIYALWYPIKHRHAVAAFASALAGCGIPKILDARLMVRASSGTPRLDGCGMVIVNPPYTLETELRLLLPELASLLAQGLGAGWSLEWLAGETPRA